MNIALDYDDTYTAAPEIFDQVVKLFKAAGHDIRFVTIRSPECNNRDIFRAATELEIPVVFTSAKQKAHVCVDVAFPVDIWIDDQPDLIPFYEDLQATANGCEKMNDLGPMLFTEPAS